MPLLPTTANQASPTDEVAALVAIHAPQGADHQHVQPFNSSIKTKFVFRNSVPHTLIPFNSTPELLVKIADFGKLDIFLLQPTWSTSPEEVIQILKHVADLHPHSKRVILDASDPSSSPLFATLDHADLLLKKQLLNDLNLYTNSAPAGWCFAQYCQDVLHWPIHNYSFGSNLARSNIPKVQLSWNIGASHQYARAIRIAKLRRALGLIPSLCQRPITVNCRVGIGQNHSFYAQHRLDSIKIAERTANSRTSAHRQGTRPPLTSREFQAELRQSQITLSPFGWGEVCFRDFEAVLAGSLLIKPDMSHLRTEPDIYRPFETYIPCRWDLQDLPDLLNRCLNNLSWAQSIADRAFTTYAAYFETRQWVGRVESLWQALSPLTLPPTLPALEPI